jgi:uncharacterized protein
MDHEQIKKQALENAPYFFSRSPVVFAYLYGSVVSGTLHPFSDLDIGVYAPPMSVRESLELELSLGVKMDEKLKNCPPADVRVINRLPLEVAGEIVNRGALIYCSDEEKRVDFEVMTRKKYFDFLPVLQMHRRAFMKRMAL